MRLATHMLSLWGIIGLLIYVLSKSCYAYTADSACYVYIAMRLELSTAVFGCLVNSVCVYVCVCVLQHAVCLISFPLSPHMCCHLS